jgi:hypothetical protein
MWVLGLVSGMNWDKAPILREGPDAQALLGWVDQYCTANPLDDLSDAALKLSREIDKRTH